MNKIIEKWGRYRLEKWRFYFGQLEWNLAQCPILFASPIAAIDLWPSEALWGGNTPLLEMQKSSKKS